MAQEQGSPEAKQPPGASAGCREEGPGAESGALLASLRKPSRRLAAAFGLDGHVAEDLVQEALVRLCACRRRGREVRHPVAWCCRVMRNLALGARSRPDSPVGPLRVWTDPCQGPVAPGTLPLDLEGGAGDPERAAVLADLTKEGEHHLARLPRPYRQIAWLQYLRGNTRAEIGELLQNWLPRSGETYRRLMRHTHQMLRALGQDLDPRERWPDRYDPRKNPWLVTPPAVFDSLGVEAFGCLAVVARDRKARPRRSASWALRLTAVDRRSAGPARRRARRPPLGRIQRSSRFFAGPEGQSEPSGSRPTLPDPTQVKRGRSPWPAPCAA